MKDRLGNWFLKTTYMTQFVIEENWTWYRMTTQKIYMTRFDADDDINVDYEEVDLCPEEMGEVASVFSTMKTLMCTIPTTTISSSPGSNHSRHTPTSLSRTNLAHGVKCIHSNGQNRAKQWRAPSQAWKCWLKSCHPRCRRKERRQIPHFLLALCHPQLPMIRYLD